MMDYLTSLIPTGVRALLKLHWQKTTSLSTANAEYYSASTAATEVLFLCNLLKSMGFAPELTPVYKPKDNTACIEWGTVVGRQEHAKHIDMRKHFALEAIQNGHASFRPSSP
jgi:hypothetical protein